LFGATAAANASPYLVTIQQVGSDVVATGSGNIDLTGLNQPPAFTGSFADVIEASTAIIDLSTGNADLLTGTISGPTNFGPGLGVLTFASSSSGPIVGFDATDTAPFNRDLRIPTGYVNDSALGTSTDTFAMQTLASLGLTPGTYQWTWGTGADQSFTVQIIGTVSSVPLPGALPLFATGLAGLGLLGWRRKKKAAAGSASAHRGDSWQAHPSAALARTAC
jgi:hypothetical protein